METKFEGKSSVKSKLRQLMLFCLCFLCVFNLFFLQWVANGKESVLIFVEASILTAFVTGLFYFIGTLLFAKKREITPFLDCLIFFFLSELSFFIVSGGEISLFGLMYRLHLNDKPIDDDVLIFREKRDISLSLSFLISAIIVFTVKIIKTKKKR